jgi:hypothetical protein
MGRATHTSQVDTRQEPAIGGPEAAQEGLGWVRAYVMTSESYLVAGGRIMMVVEITKRVPDCNRQRAGYGRVRRGGSSGCAHGGGSHEIVRLSRGKRAIPI